MSDLYKIDFNSIYTPEYFKQLEENNYKEDRAYPENFSNWYNCIESFGEFNHSRVISNQIFTQEEVHILQETDTINKVDWNKIKHILKPTLDKLNNTSLYSIKNGCFSDKFKGNICFSNKYDLCQKFWKLQYDSAMYDTGGHTEIVVRELIPYNMYTTPTIYNGLPLRTELRVFYNLDTKQIEYVVDYWDYDYCYEHLDITDKIVFDWFHKQDNYTSNLIYITDYVYKNINTLKFNNKLNGIWSIDFMLVSDVDEFVDGVYLIDMARGYRSAYWDPSKIRGEVYET